MLKFLVLCTFMSTIFAQDFNCDVSSWSQPTSSQGNCFEDGQHPSYENWLCDWGLNSGTYYNFGRCNPFASSPAYYSSYLGRMPSTMYSMMQHTTDLINQCLNHNRLEANSWGDIPYMCPDPESSFYHKISYAGGTISSMHLQSCQKVQNIFCNAIIPTSMREKVTTTTSLPSHGQLDMFAHFLAYYDYQSSLMNNPFSSLSNYLTSSYLDQFVSKVHDCQKEFWSSMIKLDCSVVRSMLNALGYPQVDWQWRTMYRSSYDRYRSRSLQENCKLIAEHIYGGWLKLIHKSIEYVIPSDSGCSASADTPPSHLPDHEGHGEKTGTDGNVVDDDGDDEDEGLSEWVIVVMVVLGVITFLGFCALLFCLIYKLYTHKPVPSTLESRYSPENGDQVDMGLNHGGTAAKAPPTPPPAYDNCKPEKKIPIE